MIAAKALNGAIQSGWLQGAGQIGRLGRLGELPGPVSSILNLELDTIDNFYNLAVRPLGAAIGAWHWHRRYGGKLGWSIAGGLFGALLPIVSTGVAAAQGAFPKLLKPRIIEKA